MLWGGQEVFWHSQLGAYWDCWMRHKVGKSQCPYATSLTHGVVAVGQPYTCRLVMLAWCRVWSRPTLCVGF